MIHGFGPWVFFSLLFSEKSKYLAIWLGIFLTPLSSPFVIILQLRCLFLGKSDVLLSPTRGQMTEVLFSCQNTHQLAATCQALIILLIWVSIASTGGGVLFGIDTAKFGLILALLSQIQGGRTWQPFVGSKNGNENFRQSRIYNLCVKCVVFARNRKFAKLTKWNMQYIPCNIALLAQGTLFLTQKGTYFAQRSPKSA